MRKFFGIKDYADCEDYKCPFTADPSATRDAYFILFNVAADEIGAGVGTVQRYFVVIDYLVLCTEKVQVAQS